MNEIVIPVLNKDFKVVFTWGEPEEVKKVLKKYNYPVDEVTKDHFRGRGICFDCGGCYPIIALPKFPKTSEEIATLAHEAVHAVDYIFETIGEENGGEVFAHSVSAIVEKVLIDGKKKVKKKNARPTAASNS